MLLFGFGIFKALGVNGVSSMAKIDIFTEGFSEELHNLFTKDYAALSSY